jgi:hypothetical protein
VGQASDPAEVALAQAVLLATKAEQWELAGMLSRQLADMRRARTAPTVSSLDDERDRRGGKR